MRSLKSIAAGRRWRGAGFLSGGLTLALIAPVLWILGIELDVSSQAYLEQAITSSAIIYGLARGINALVSVLQSTEVSLMLVSIDIGEILDPLNDLIERFSDVLVAAMFALALQQILLGIVSHNVFNLLLGAFALVFLVSRLTPWTVLKAGLLRMVLMLLFLRFALTASVLAAGWVDRLFLLEPVEAQTASLEQLKRDLSKTSDQVSGLADQNGEGSQLTEQLAAAQQRRRALQADYESAAAALEAEEARIEAEKRQLALWRQVRRSFWPEWLRNQDDELGPARDEKSRLEGEIDGVEAQIEGLNESLTCLRLRANGKPCGLWERFTWGTPDAAAKRSLLSLADNLDEYAHSIVNLMVALLLKSLILPLLFLFACYRFLVWLCSVPL